jgi:hypothetical protein
MRLIFPFFVTGAQQPYKKYVQWRKNFFTKQLDLKSLALEFIHFVEKAASFKRRRCR